MRHYGIFSDIYDQRLENGRYVITWVDELHSPGDKFRQRKILRVEYKSKYFGTVVIRRGTKVQCMRQWGDPPVRATVVDFPLEFLEHLGKIVLVEFKSRLKSRKYIHINDLISLY